MQCVYFEKKEHCYILNTARNYLLYKVADKNM